MANQYKLSFILLTRVLNIFTNRIIFFKQYVKNRITRNSQTNKIVCALLVLILFYNYSYAVDCYTTSDNTWSCGTPDPADNLIVDHHVTIASDFPLTGSITVNEGGYLNITGNLVSSGGIITVYPGGTLIIDNNMEIKDNCILVIYGDVFVYNDFKVRSSSTFRILSGSFTVNGNVTLEDLSITEIQADATCFFNHNFTTNSGDVAINGDINVTDNFTNAGQATGSGTISYGGNCGGVGMINGIESSVYCGSNPLDLSMISCETMDTTPPVFTIVRIDPVVYLSDSQCEASVSWDPPTFTDDCELDTVYSSHDPGDIFQPGSTEVIYSAHDKAGNFSQTTFTVNVLDTITPLIYDMPADMITEAASEACGATVNWTPPTASDNCSVNLSADYLPGSYFPGGTTSVTYTAIDASGNESTGSFEITVLDNNPPVFSVCPSSYEISSVDTAAKNAIITWELPVAEDNCSGISINSNYNPGDVFDFGVAKVVYTATDQSGNTAECSFSVRAGMNMPPKFNNQKRKVLAGDPLDIILDAEDPEGDHVQLVSVFNNKSNSTISRIDRKNLSFVYTAKDDFYGYDTLRARFIDDGIPPASTLGSVIIDVERKVRIQISGAITPDGDQLNDTWYIKDIDYYPGNSISIHDRWGGLVYQVAGYDNVTVVWDGSGNRVNNKLLPAGTYFYVIDLGAGIRKITGAVELIR